MATDQRFRDRPGPYTIRFAIANTAAQVLFLVVLTPAMFLDPDRLLLWAILWVVLSALVMWLTIKYPGIIKKIK